MKILYGVEATGNGHITRARAMAPALQAAGISVDFLFSGRTKDKLFDMAQFDDFDCRTGLTFATRKGRLSIPATLAHNRPLQLWRDIGAVDFSRYDLVLTDYEPITAWGARLNHVPAIGIGHQYAFAHRVPRVGGAPAQQLVMDHFAPAKTALGLHWHHFNAPIAPLHGDAGEVREGIILVYLPFESVADISALLEPFADYQVIAYHPEAPDQSDGNIQWHRPGRETFHRDLLGCAGVICSAGFELSSEVLQLGRKLLATPLLGQPEQASNALALEQLGLGTVMASLDRRALGLWLTLPQPGRVIYPDVATAISRWLVDGSQPGIPELARELWQQCQFPANFRQPGSRGSKTALSRRRQKT